VQYGWTQTLCFTEWKWQQIALSEAEVEPGAASGTHSFKDIASKLNTAARCHIVWQRPNSRIININSLYTWATEAILAVSLRCIVGVCKCSQLMSHDMHAHVARTLTLKNTHTHTHTHTHTKHSLDRRPQREIYLIMNTGKPHATIGCSNNCTWKKSQWETS